MADLVWFSDARNQKQPNNQYAGPCRVFIDGIDFTPRCFRVERFDDGTSVAHCYQQNDAGLILTDDGRDVKTEVIPGNIEVRPIEEGN